MEDIEAGQCWSSILKSVLWIYHASPHSSLQGVSLSKLVLGIDVLLPFEVASWSPRAPSDTPVTNEQHRELVATRLRALIDLVPSLRDRQKIQKQAPKTLLYFNVGDRVWARDSKIEQHAPVFAPRWKGPFIMVVSMDKNVYRIRTDPKVTGKKTGIVANSINGCRLWTFIDNEVVNAE